MKHRNIKAFALLLALLVPAIYFGSSACLTQPHCSCCPDQKGTCLMETDQDSLIAVQSEKIELPHPSAISSLIEVPEICQARIYEIRDIAPINLSLQFKTTHPSNGPPLA